MANVTKTFSIDGKEWRFDARAFNKVLEFQKQSRKVTKEFIYNEIAKNLSVSVDTVKNWKGAKNGPSSLDMVQDLANYLNVELLSLLQIKEDKKMNNIYNIEQVKSAKRVSDLIIVLLKDCLDTEGFSVVYGGIKLSDGHKFESDFEVMDVDGFNYLCRRIDAISVTLEQERIFIHDTKIYDFFYGFIDKLYDFFKSLYYEDEEFIKSKNYFDERDRMFKQEYMKLSNELDEAITSLM